MGLGNSSSGPYGKAWTPGLSVWICHWQQVVQPLQRSISFRQRKVEAVDTSRTLRETNVSGIRSKDSFRKISPIFFWIMTLTPMIRSFRIERGINIVSVRSITCSGRSKESDSDEADTGY